MRVDEIKDSIRVAMEELKRRLRETSEGEAVDMTVFVGCTLPELNEAAAMSGVAYFM